jgi:dihydroorotate dehydrogenase electron transfer subunit
MKAIHQASLLKNRALAPQLYEMELLAPTLAAAAKPGQFVMVRIGENQDPLLRRPFGLAGIDPDSGRIRLVYQVVGRGTEQMSHWRTGRTVDVLGPLGNGFTWTEDPDRVILAGGGLGIAPLLPLAQALRKAGKEVTVFLGSRSEALLFGLQELTELGCGIQLATEDGSQGFKGFLTTPLEHFLCAQALDSVFLKAKEASESGKGHAHVHTHAMLREGLTETGFHQLYACGPAPFLRAVGGLAARYALPAQLSFEERMACGVGACMGCAIRIKNPDGTVKTCRVCSDGPVFTGEEVVWNG